MEITITKENFDEKILKSDKTVLVDFFATWCGPCMQLSPIVKKIADEHNEYVIGKVNVDEEIELATKFGVVSIPTIIVFKNGTIADKAVGLCSENELLSMLEKA